MEGIPEEVYNCKRHLLFRLEDGGNAKKMPPEITGMGGDDATVVDESIVPDLAAEGTER